MVCPVAFCQRTGFEQPALLFSQTLLYSNITNNTISNIIAVMKLFLIKKMINTISCANMYSTLYTTAHFMSHLLMNKI